MKAAVGLGDLARLFATLPPAQAVETAALLGFHEAPAPPVAPRLGPRPPETSGERKEREWREAVASASASRGAGATMSFWRLEEMTFVDEQRRAEPLPAPPVGAEGISSDDLRSPGKSLFRTSRPPPLTPWSKLWPVLQEGLSAAVPGRDPDVAALTRAWARGEWLPRIPRARRKVWAARASVWLDYSARLVPFWSDAAAVFARLRDVCGTGVVMRFLDASAQGASLQARGDYLAGFTPRAEVPVLVLGDLGFYGEPREREAWRATGQRLRARGIVPSALVPAPRSRWEIPVARAFDAVPWEYRRPRRSVVAGAVPGGKSSPPEGTDPALRLLRLASPASYVQLGLLRTLRKLLPATVTDASSEVDALRRPEVRAFDAGGYVLHAEAARTLREALGNEDVALHQAVSDAIRQWHEGLPRELLRLETCAWLANMGGTPPGDEHDARAFAARWAVSSRQRGGGAEARALAQLGRKVFGAMPRAAYEAVPELKWACARAFEDVERAPLFFEGMLAHQEELRRQGDPAATLWPRWWAVRQRGDQLLFEASPDAMWPSRDPGPGSPVAWLLAAEPLAGVWRDGVLTGERLPLKEGSVLTLRAGEKVLLETDRCRAVLTDWARESWAVAAGRDRYGLWADAEVKAVLVRFRWIPPGRAWMGSPEVENGRINSEGPRHLVTWTEGRWVAETPVTQALWQAALGTNPSRFRSADRPVESVSWDECKEVFLPALRQLGFEARLLTEAEWEYACRAGTETATWLGDLDLQGENNAPILDAVAWYSGNSGQDFDLPDGEDSGDWPEKQYAHTRAGIRAVAKKVPNPFGLSDMLGNVFEWCEDALDGSAYEAGTKRNPPARSKGSDRVVRGGSWDGYARNVRAANRGANPPGSSNGSLGFRLVRGQAPSQEGAEPQVRASLAAEPKATSPRKKT